MPTHKSRLRRGSGTLELILALPVLFIVTLAIFQFGILMVVQQTVTTAATDGARAAAKEITPAVANAAAIAAVNDTLAVHSLVVDPTSTDTTSDTKLVVEYGGTPDIITGDPDLSCSTPSSPALGPTEVRVTVCVDLTTSPLLNVLTSFGFDLSGRRFEISSMATIE
jgi:Flp pilus assembly protein TadG